MSILRILVAIKSCEAHAGRDQSVRQTWLLNRVLDYRFFIGRGQSHGDVQALDVPDTYEALPFKTQAICSWALEHDYDYVFLCDNDTYVCVPRLLGSDFYASDYTGFFVRCVSCTPSESGHCQCRGENDQPMFSYASGGSGYWLSRRAMKVIVQADFTKDPLRPDRPEPSTRGEDLQVGWALGRSGILCRNDHRYSLYWPGPRMDNTTITFHNATQFAEHERMMVIHRAWFGSGGH